MRPHGRAQVSSRNPRAFGICDRCGFLYNHDRLKWQFDWAGASLINKRILVCDTCNDVPQQQLRAIIVPADPVPILNPRVQDYPTAETNTRATSGQNTIDPVTNIPIINGDTRVTSDGFLTGGDILLENLTGYLMLEGNVYYLTQEPVETYVQGPTRVTQQTGEPPGGLNQQPGTNPNAPGDNDPGLPYNYDEVPKTGPLD